MKKRESTKSLYDLDPSEVIFNMKLVFIQYERAYMTGKKKIIFSPTFAWVDKEPQAKEYLYLRNITLP